MFPLEAPSVIDPEDFDDELPPRRRPWLWIVAAVLVISVAIAFGANALVSIAPSVFRSAGDPDAYAFLHVDPETSHPTRYDPCSPIRYVINRDSAPEGAIADVEDAITDFEDGMDADFVFAGFTDEVPTGDRAIYQPDRYGKGEWAPILFAWVPPEDMLQPDDEAVGAAGSSYIDNGRGESVYVTGTVTFNSQAKLLPGFELGDSWGDVALHELGHIVGLAHVEDDNQVMFPDVTSGDARLGAGDLAGLRRLGRDGGCVFVPRPK